jgi:hypothetical protein
LLRIRKDVARVLRVVENNARVVESNADELSSVRRDVAASIRRCAEIQAELDRLKKLLAVA